MNDSAQLEIVLDHKCTLGEGPVWDEATQTILWLDIVEGLIHQYNINLKTFSSFNVGEMVGCIAFHEHGDLIAGVRNGIAFINREKNIVQHLANPEAGLSNRFNDGKCDVAGRFWVGTMALTEEENKGNLYVMETDLSIKKKIENVSISNGIAWSADNKTMYYINTPTNYVFAFDYDVQSGNIDNQRVVIDLTHENGYADGMTIDNEDMLWIAFFGGWRVARYNPQNGEFLSQVELPVANVTCCTFGGNDFEDLYISTANKGLSKEDLEKQPDAGKLFVLKNSGFKGMPAMKFRG